MSARDAEKEFGTHLKTAQFAPVYLFGGADEFRKDAALQALLTAAVDPTTRDFNLDQTRGGEATPEGIASFVHSPPMMADRRVVVIREVDALRKAARAALDSYLVSPSPDVVLVLVLAAGAKPDAALEKRAFTLTLDALTGQRLEKWIRSYVTTTLGATITDAAVTLLLESGERTSADFATELDKLASYARGGAIDADAVEAIVGVRRGESLGDLLDAVAARDGARARALVATVLQLPKLAAVQVVSALTVQTAALGWGAAMRASGTPLNSLAKQYFDLIKQTGAYPYRSWGDAASAWTKAVPFWTVAQADAGLAALLHADSMLKETTVSNDIQILETAVLQVAGVPAERRAA
jgi:DNA polymerase III subunit delta